MPESAKMERAQLRELNADFQNEKSGGKQVSVQFNPETLKVSFNNQVQTQEGAPSRLFVGAGTTKLAVQLWFDVTALPPEDTTKDVRDLTREVVYFITPQPEGQNFIPPALRFVWGSFSFDGIVESVEENLEFFSSEGRPLRANLSLNLTQQKIPPYEPRPGGRGGQPPGVGGPGGAPVGTSPLTQARAGVSLQGLAEAAGRGDWQSVAAANGVENPRLLATGQLLDLNMSAGGRI
jgi:hypothetical protein